MTEVHGDEERLLRVLIVDDHDLFRSGLATLLREHGVEVVGEATTGEEAVRLVESRLPTVVIMDLGLPGISGLAATRQVRAINPAAAILVLTASLDETDVIDALIAGAAGYLLKDATVEQIMEGMEGALVGDAVISPRVNRLLVERVREAASHERAPTGPAPHVTGREAEILRLLVQGRENNEIANELFLSPSTVKNHVSAILTKLGVNNRIQAAVLAVRERLV
jgi:DNA-binding NarL/FixJ family response regulator